MSQSIWQVIASFSHIVGACSTAALAVWILGKRDRLGLIGWPIVVALTTTAAWAIATAASGTESSGSALSESFRNLSWTFVVWRLFRSDGRAEQVRLVRPVAISLAAVEITLGLLLIVLHRGSFSEVGQRELFMVCVTLRLLFATGALVLLHNLYSGAGKDARARLRWPASALAIVWLYDLNLYTVAYLNQAWPAELAALRGFTLALAMLLLFGLVSKRGQELEFAPSRAVTFQFVSLAGIGAYLAAMMLAARSLAWVGGDFAPLMEFGVLIAALTLALLTLPSKRVRGWVKVTLVKHLFRHRYDYRNEWLRFAQTIGRSGENALPLEERAVKAVAQITDSPAGLLLVPGEDGDLVMGGRWQWPLVEAPASAIEPALAGYLEASGYILELDAVRAGKQEPGRDAGVPAWLLEEPRAWTLVPLRHYGRLVGVIVLARPPHDRPLDWEDFDLLRVVGQQVATTLAEHAGQDALAEAARFDEFNRRIAFVMHDIKNLASQLGLLARNAESHAGNPDFRADMLLTLRNSADKLNALIARLSRYGPQSAEGATLFDLGELTRQVVDRFAANHRVSLTECQGGEVRANREAVEQALIHLVQNAVDASGPDLPVFLSQTSSTVHASIEVVDSGPGMSPEFIRTRLFKPFVSSKQGGFGIGAFEARELVRSAHGRLDVESREGLGTRFIVRLPLASAAQLLSTYDNQEQDAA